MPTYIENAMLKCIEYHHLLPFHDNRDRRTNIKDKRVAVIGERDPKITKDSFAQALFEKFHLTKKRMSVFTAGRKFHAIDAEHFDYLIGVRPCEGEIEILKGATMFKKKFMLMPCNCGRVVRKIPKLIREYPIIERIEAETAKFDDGTPEGQAWMILFN